MKQQQNFLRARRFTEEDFPIYRAWYADEWLNRQLGPMDEEWLTNVLSDAEGEQWSFFVEGTLIAVVGLTPDQSTHTWIISDFAVNPMYRNQGWGQRVWEALIALPVMLQRNVWRA